MEDSPERGRTPKLILAGLSLLLSGAALALPDTIRPLWPALVALSLVFATRQAPLSLATACLSALFLLSFKDWSSFSGWFGWSGGLWRTLSSPWHFYAILFTLLLGALAAVVESSGGLLRLLHATGEITDRTRQRFLSSVLGLGLLCFFDGLANALMLPGSMAFIEAADLTDAQQSRIQTIRTLFAKAGRAGDLLADETRAWFAELGIKFGLKNHNILANDLGNLADEAFLDTCHATNLIPVTRDDLAAVYEKAF